MKKVIVYLIFVLLLISAAALADLSKSLPAWSNDYRLWLRCVLLGSLGGALYCLRSVYLNACVRKKWDADWETWYYLRPLGSAICGLVSCLFLKAGLLLLEAGQKTDSSQLGFYAFAFIAGLNVDNFVAKIEDIALSTWGIQKSRASQGRDVIERSADPEK
jgi:hypothetical protein